MGFCYPARMSEQQLTGKASYDCVVVGSCVVDLLCRPVSLDQPIGHGVLHEIGPMVVAGGGITSNSGVTMARLGLDIGVFTYVGDDAWGPVIRQLYRAEGIDDSPISVHPDPDAATSTTAVMIDPSGERSFYHCVGAPKLIDSQAMLDRLDLFARSQYLLLGYYSLMPNLESDLADVLARIRQTGCKTALDAAGEGGTMEPLSQLLPHLDVYVPSLAEAEHQTGLTDPRAIIDLYRGCGAPGIVGVKLGKSGVLLSEKPGEYVDVPICTPPGDVVDTTGAGDSFYGGFLAGLIKGMPMFEAGRLGTAAAACCVTAMGGCGGGRNFDETTAIAGLNKTIQ